MTRPRPITGVQTLLGLVAMAAGVGVIVLVSHALRLPALQVAELPPPELEDTGDQPGAVSCPTRGELDRRPQPLPVTSEELIECPSLFDGERVRYTGEAVGAVLLRQTRAWVHLNDDLYALQLGPTSRHRTTAGGNSGMAVSVPREDALGVKVGNYRTHGTALAIEGIYWRSDPNDGGAPVIAAESVRVVRDAQRFDHPLSFRRVLVAPPLLLVALVLLGLALRRRRLLQ